LLLSIGCSLEGSCGVLLLCDFSQVAHAQQHGALGVILYNDPIDYVDKSITNSTFPNSWFLPPSGAQRGSLAMDKGDALTEGYPAKGREYISF